MLPTPSTRPPAGCSGVSLAVRWVDRPLPRPVLFFAAVAGCQTNEPYSNSNRLPPEEEFSRLSDPAPPTKRDPRSFSQEELEARDGAKAVQDAENIGVKARE